MAKVLKDETANKLSRKLGVTNIGGVGSKVRRFTDLPPTEGADWILFELSADLDTPLGSQADAVILATSNDSDYPIGATVTVTNATDAYGFDGAQGQAIKAGDDWQVVVINTPSQFVVCTAATHSHAWTGSSGSPMTAMPAAVTPLTATSPTMLSEWPSNNDLGVGLPLPIKNPYGLFWRSDDLLLIMHSLRDGGCYEVVRVLTSTRIKFKFAANVGTGTVTPSTAAMAILPADNEGIVPTAPITVDPIASITVYDRYYKSHNAKTGDQGIAQYNIGDNVWEIIECEHLATHLKGRVQSGGFSGTPASFTTLSASVVGLNGKTPSGILTIKNRFGWSNGDASAWIDFWWDNVAGEYYATQMYCPST